jgi:hypothetical protein
MTRPHPGRLPPQNEVAPAMPQRSMILAEIAKTQ